MESEIHGSGRFLYSVRFEKSKSEELWLADGWQDLFNKICSDLQKINNFILMGRFELPFSPKWYFFVCKQWGKTILPTMIMEVL